MKASIVGAVLACSLLFAPVAHAETNYVPIGDPYTDTLQLWSGIATALSSLANDVSALFNAHQFAAAKALNVHHVPKQLPAAMAASAALGVASPPVSTTLAANEEFAATATGSPQSRSPPTAGPSPVIYRVVQTPAFDASAFVTRNQFNAAMAALGSSVQQLLAVSQSTPLPQYVAADGNAAIPYAAENNITNLSNVTITNPNISGLSASDIPDLSGTYLSLSGGAVNGTTSFANDVGIGTTTPSDVLAVNGPIFLANVSPSATSNRLYSNAGSLYWNGSLIGGGSVGNWATDGTNVWRAGGNVGIGTTSPTATLAVAGNTFLGGNLTATGTLAVSGNTTLANATSSTFFSTIGDFTNGVINSLSGTTLTYTAASTTNLTVSGNATLGNATTTNLFSTTASSTNLFAQTASLGMLSAGTLALTNALPVSSGGTGSTTLAGILKGNGTGALQTAIAGTDYLAPSSLSAAYPLLYSGNTFSLAFGTTTANAWSQLQTLQSGFVSQASSTIVGPLTLTGTLSAQGATFNGSLAAQGGGTLSGTFSGIPIFNSGFISQASSTFSSTLNANTLNLFNPLGVGNGGTGTSTWQTGSIPFYNGSNFTENNSNLFWDNTNGRLGIGTSTPQTPLDVGELISASNPSPAISAAHSAAYLSKDVNGVAGVVMYNPDLGNTADFRFAIQDTTGNYFAVAQPGVNNNQTLFGLNRNTTSLIFNAGGTTRDIGIGTVGNNNLVLGTNGANRLQITGAGNVGIGTTSPGSLLSLGGIANFTAATSTLYSTGGINLAAGCFSINGTCIGVHAASSTLLSDNNTFSGNDIFSSPLSLNSTTGTSTIASGQGFTIGGSQFVVQQGSGNVGIGTTSPDDAFAVSNGSFNFNMGLNTGVQIDTTGETAQTNLGTSNSFAPLEIYNSSNAGIGIFNASGQLGVGTVSPKAQLQIARSSAPTAITLANSYLHLGGAEDAANSYRLISFGYSNSNTYMPAYMGYQETNTASYGSGDLVFGTRNVTTDTQPSEVMRITAGGNIGIGTTSPDQLLSINGNVDIVPGRSYDIGDQSALYASTTNNGASINGLAVGAAAAAAWMSASSTPIWDDIGIGLNSLATTPLNSTTIRNLAIGRDALQDDNTGADNTAVGFLSLQQDTGGNQNTAIGYQTLQANNTGADNTAVGFDTLLNNTSGQENTAVGYQALGANYGTMTGSYNDAFGYDALNDDTTGQTNEAIGRLALDLNTTGSSNVGIGGTTLNDNITGSNNTSIGYNSSRYNTSPTSTVAIGYQAAIGSSATFNNQGGTAVGYQSGFSFQTGSNYNTLLGYQSGYDITTGAHNIVLGSEDSNFDGLTTGSNNIVIGNNTSALTATANNQLDIGNLIFGTGLSGTGSTIAGNLGIGTTSPYSLLSITNSASTAANTPLLTVASTTGGNSTSTLLTVLANGNVGIGTSTPFAQLDLATPVGASGATTNLFLIASSTSGTATTTLFDVLNTGNAVLAGTLTQNSDQRLKTDIESLDGSSSLAAIDALTPVSYQWQGNIFGSDLQLGFIAQQVQPIFPQLVSTTSATALTPNGTLGLNYTGLISPIVSAIQQLDQELTNLANTVAGFAQSITSAAGNFGTVNTGTLCITSGANDPTPVCVTKAQLAALLGQTASAQTPESVTQTPTQNSTPNLPESATSTSTSNASTGQGSVPPQIQINGSNPAIIQVGTTYNDLGATITGPQQDLNLGIKTYLNGTLSSNIVINATQVATDTIQYVATDQTGLTSTSTRTVIVEAPANDNQATSSPANDNSPPPAATSTGATTTVQ